MGNCFSSPKEIINPGPGAKSETAYATNTTPNRTGAIATDIGHPITSNQSRPADTYITPNVTNTNAGFFNAAQNLAITGGQFLEVHGNYVVCHDCACIYTYVY
jgi:hypothetical protein